MALVMFGLYILTGNELTVAKVFSIITYIQLLRISIRILPFAIALLVGQFVATKRLNVLLNAEEQKDMILQGREMNVDNINDSNDIIIGLNRASFRWAKAKGDFDPNKKDDNKNKSTSVIKTKKSADGETPTKNNDEKKDDVKQNEVEHEFILNDITLNIKKGKLYGLIGEVGSGKSSLIRAILSEMKQLDGGMVINNDNSKSIAFCPQLPFIVNDTVRNNILFGLEYNEKYYKKVLKAASLTHDLSIMAAGDMTEIGARGINLSGGQKARISFARCLYNKLIGTNIYLLDDPLSAVDVHVGNNMFHEGIKKILKDETILLVMNSHLSLLKHVDYILVMDKNNDHTKGSIIYQGTYNEMMDMLDNNNNEMENVDLNDNLNHAREIITKLIPKTNGDQDETKTEPGSGVLSPATPLSRQNSDTSTISPLTLNDEQKEAKGKLIRKEDRKQGSVSLGVYVQYFANAANKFDHHLDYNEQPSSRWFGWFAIILEVLLLFGGQTFLSLADIWLAFWSEESEQQRFPNRNDDWWLMVWSILIAVLTILVFLSSYLFGYLGIRAAQSVHMKTLYCVLRAPMSYFDSTPTGQTLNRFSKDTHEMDDELSRNFMSFASTTLECVGYIIVIVISIPFALLLMIIVLPCIYILQKFFRMSSSDLKRLNQISFSPIITQFSESLEGLDTVRAFNKRDMFLNSMMKKIRNNHKIFFADHMGIRWLATCMDSMMAVFIFLIALLAAYLRDVFNPALLSLSVVYAYSFMGLLQWAVRYVYISVFNIK